MKVTTPDRHTVELCRLDGTPGDIEAAQRVVEAAPGYALLATGVPPGATDAARIFTVLPDGKGHDDKFVLGVFDGDTMVGLVDLVRGYPSAHVAYVGLLLIAEPHQGLGIGSAAAATIEAYVRDWGTCDRLRLGVLASNTRAARFWTRYGYASTGETKPYSDGPVTSQVVVYEKRLTHEDGRSA